MSPCQELRRHIQHEIPALLHELLLEMPSQTHTASLRFPTSAEEGSCCKPLLAAPDGSPQGKWVRRAFGLPLQLWWFPRGTASLKRMQMQQQGKNNTGRMLTHIWQFQVLKVQDFSAATQVRRSSETSITLWAGFLSHCWRLRLGEGSSTQVH